MPMAATTTTYRYLLPKRGSTSYKQLYVNGVFPTWVFHAYHIGDEEDPAMSVEELAENFNVPVAAVEEALAYYRSNPPEMADDFRKEEALMEATGMNDPGYKMNPIPKLLDPIEIARIWN